MVGNGGIGFRKQMVPEIDCVRSGFVKKIRGNEWGVGVGGWADLVPLSCEWRGDLGVGVTGPGRDLRKDWIAFMGGG